MGHVLPANCSGEVWIVAARPELRNCDCPRSSESPMLAWAVQTARSKGRMVRRHRSNDTHIWYAFTEWQLMILGYNWIIKAFSASFRIIFCIISENLTTSNCGPNFGSNFGKAKAIDRDRSALDILDLLLEVPWWLWLPWPWLRSRRHDCHDCHDERQAIVELLGYEAVLEGFDVVLCSVYSVPFSRRCLMSFVLCHSMDILWVFKKYVVHAMRQKMTEGLSTMVFSSGEVLSQKNPEIFTVPESSCAVFFLPKNRCQIQFLIYLHNISYILNITYII